MSVIPERHLDELDDEPADDADDRRAARHERPEPGPGWAPVTAADFVPKRP